jgi:hypothetical protein
MRNSLPHLKNDEERMDMERNWRFLTSRRKALEMWFSHKCPDEKMWLTMWLRSSTITRLSLVNAKEGPFRVGDRLRFRVDVSPSRCNVGLKLKNGNAAKGISFSDDDYLTSGLVFCAFDGTSCKKAALNPGRLGIGR